MNDVRGAEGNANKEMRRGRGAKVLKELEGGEVDYRASETVVSWVNDHVTLEQALLTEHARTPFCASRVRSVRSQCISFSSFCRY